MNYLLFLWSQIESVDEWEGKLSLETREMAVRVAVELDFSSFLTVTDAMEI